jgi:putative flavoprotein involved in K+ transport
MVTQSKVRGNVGGRSTDRVEVVVVGAGQAGLAMGYFLAKQGLRFVILDAADSIASAWRARWESLTLFTSRRFSSLPGLTFPGDPNGYATRNEVISYLERYATTFELPIELNSEVKRLTAEEGQLVLELADREIVANQVVIATGPFQKPFVPDLAGGLMPDVFQIHSTGYQRPEQMPHGTVVVVGGGNTGFQIVKELSATRSVTLSVGSHQKPLPQRLLGRDLFWWLTKTRILDKTVESRLARKLSARDTLIGSSPRQLKRDYRVVLRPRAVGAAGRTIHFEDGSSSHADAVIWATGYRSDYSWVDLPITDERGRLRHRRGVSDVPGLYFLGLTWQHTRGSALIGFVKDDAEFIAQRVAELRTKTPTNAGTPEAGAASFAQSTERI